MRFRILYFLILSFVFFASCQQRPIAKIEVMGRVVDSLGAPQSGQVRLDNDDPNWATHTYTFATVTVKPDGSFDIKTHAGWNSDQYYLVISSGPYHLVKRCYIPDNKSVDLGDIKVN